MSKNKIKIEQAIGYNCIIISANLNGLPVERFSICEEIGNIDFPFYVKSDKGVDTRGNDLYFTSIELAIKYIREFALKSREYPIG